MEFSIERMSKDSGLCEDKCLLGFDWKLSYTYIAVQSMTGVTPNSLIPDDILTSWSWVRLQSGHGVLCERRIIHSTVKSIAMT